MAAGLLEHQDFDRYLSLSEKHERGQAVKSNDAFAAAMNSAIKRGKVQATAGTFVDTSPSYARRIHGEAAISACGSPSAMCLA